MLKISRKSSVILSISFTLLWIVCILAGFFLMPRLATFLINSYENVTIREIVGKTDFILITADAYLILSTALSAIVLLLKLLLNIRKSIVFTAGNVSIIRTISWLCFLEGFAFLLLGFRFVLAFIVAAAAFFLGLVVRVVKNVMEEATAIKSENDLTV